MTFCQNLWIKIFANRLGTRLRWNLRWAVCPCALNTSGVEPWHPRRTPQGLPVRWQTPLRRGSKGSAISYPSDHQSVLVILFISTPQKTVIKIGSKSEAPFWACMVLKYHTASRNLWLLFHDKKKSMCWHGNLCLHLRERNRARRRAQALSSAGLLHDLLIFADVCWDFIFFFT